MKLDREAKLQNHFKDVYVWGMHLKGASDIEFQRIVSGRYRKKKSV
jgi:hypothetical protein